ncbi:tetratricopeptide repeat protein [Hymenobacter metallicola]|uniref:Tetratricopeptide repeat protein n=1 Tax=Hymenobacter metallicola TaxID=2563114 RepID=A0A4Z0QAV1_9BACT|nr:tetratricopeptide repeat protein [Hymenobacter metallicola]TGE26586.1 tetratricopeptide repeat protein [Hymenobacter metallicola]
MPKPYSFLVGLFLTTIAAPAVAQTPQEQAYTKGMEAIKLMDNGNLAQSIVLLEEARRLDPKDFNYPYELGYALYMQKEYGQAIKMLAPLLTHKDASDKVFQLLGNSYDMDGDAKKAVATYESGLKQFPASGSLYLELGNMKLGQKQYTQALEYYEKGIEVAPAFPSNYFRAAKIYLSSTSEMWGLLYGEVFMNLERNSPRTAEMSKLLYDTYKSEITFPNDSATAISLAPSLVVSVADVKHKKFKMPYSASYETCMGVAVGGHRTINLTTLDAIRSSFVVNYYSMKLDEKYPSNILVDYQQQIAQAGYAEAYNHWLLMMGDEDGFTKWLSINKIRFDDFAAWFNKHPLVLDDKHKLLRSQF